MATQNVTTNFDELDKKLKGFERQIPFIVTTALNDLAFDGLKAWRKELTKLDAPKPFTLQSGQVVKANKKQGKFESSIRVRRDRLDYLRHQLEGGSRPLKLAEKRAGAGYAVPSRSQLKIGGDRFGNISKKKLVTALERIKAKTNKGQWVVITDENRSDFGDRQPGLYQRKRVGGVTRLRPVLFTNESSGKYKRTIQFHRPILRAFNRNFDRRVNAAVEKALRTAR